MDKLTILLNADDGINLCLNPRLGIYCPVPNMAIVIAMAANRYKEGKTHG